MKKQATIHDIAKLADVSSATVSRVLSNSGYPVSKELRERITRIADEVNYVPNLLGRQLKTSTNTTIGVIVPSITNPFYSAVLLGIEEVARKNNYHVLLCNSLHAPELADQYIRTIFEKQIRGLIISAISSNKKLLQDYVARGLNVVAIDQKVDMSDLSQVEFDYHQGGLMATRYLLDNGHRRIAYVTAPLDRPSRKSILQGYTDAMLNAGLAVNVIVAESKQVYSGVYEFENGKQLTSRLMEQEELPEAVLACNDMTAFGVIHQLQEAGLRVPDDVSVMGFDGIEFGQIMKPALTTIKQPNYEMGRLACAKLVETMQGESGEPLHMMLQPALIERDSVAGRHG
ncbi:MAG: transcriptional regulator, LacI family protein [Paenibacillaceae bacterium]|nr:transcriptional regulator, LacI family protein [Paenibacillaceae bacterium]